MSSGQSSMNDVIQGSMVIVTANAETTAKNHEVQTRQLLHCNASKNVGCTELLQGKDQLLLCSLSILRTSEEFGTA